MSTEQELVQARATNVALEASLEIALESMGRLQLQLEDVGWQKIGAWGDQEFTTTGLKESAKLCRTMAVASPLIKRGLGVRNSYIWGGGHQIRAKDDKVNTVVQEFLQDEGNRRSMFGEQATEKNERTLGTDGNLFIMAFPHPVTGRVQVRTLPFDEISDVVTNPDDRDEPWLYLREYDVVEVLRDGSKREERKKVYYPAMEWSPKHRIRALGGVKVDWTAHVLHVKVNALDGWKFGIGDAYAALPYARLYRDFLADWSTLTKALSQFAFRVAGGSASSADKLRQAIAQATSNGQEVGQTAVMDANTNIEAIPKTGATIDSESGKPLAAMAASAMGIPVTVLLGDPGQTGARAVAETLDKPTVAEMTARRGVWENTLRVLINYVIKQSVKSSSGLLRGTIVKDPWSDHEIVSVQGDPSLAVEFVWASLKDTSTATAVQAVVNADSTGKVPPLVTLRLLLSAMEVPDLDEIIDGVARLFTGWEPVLGPVERVGDTDNQSVKDDSGTSGGTPQGDNSGDASE